MFDPQYVRAGRLWSELIDSIEAAGGNMAASLESFSAKQLIRNPQLDAGQRKLLIHRFAIEGRVDGKSPLEMFMETRTDLSATDRQLLASWQRSFVALLAIVQVFDNGLEVMNWLTAKHYRIQYPDEAVQSAMSRLKVGDVIIAQISPIVGIDWAILSPWISLGKLGRPKLAVAIGAFRQNYPHYLYSDAPKQLEAAWESVAVYHDRFVEFFGSDEVTLAGKDLQKRIGEFQTWMVEQQLAAAGIDKSKSLADVAADAGVDAEELADLTQTLGLEDVNNAKAKSTPADKMVSPPVELPDRLKHAPIVTALSHEYWGQMFLADYQRLEGILSANAEFAPADLQFLHKSLADPQMNAFIWRRLATKHPDRLQTALGRILELPDFKLLTDLDRVLTKFNKFLEPDLPDLASVPIHLHELFQAAVLEVSKEKSKSKTLPKKTGFGAKS
jgi:hypothetical protein